MVHFSGADTSPYAFLYLWVALYALYFFTATRAAMHIIFIAIAYAGVLALDLTAGQHLESGLLTAFGEAAPRWSFTVGTLVVAVAFVSLLKNASTGSSSGSRTLPARTLSPGCETGAASTRPSTSRWSGPGAQDTR